MIPILCGGGDWQGKAIQVLPTGLLSSGMTALAENRVLQNRAQGERCLSARFQKRNSFARGIGLLANATIDHLLLRFPLCRDTVHRDENSK